MQIFIKERGIIFFASYAPLPLNGGSTRSFYLLKGLSQKGPVDLVILNSIDPDQKVELQKFCRSVYSAVSSKHRTPGLSKKIIIAIKWILPFLMSNSELNGRIYSLVLGTKDRQSIQRTLKFRWLLAWFRLRHPYPCDVYLRYNAIRYLEKDIFKLLLSPHKLIFFDFNYLLPALAKKFHFANDTIVANSHNVEADLYFQAIQGDTDFVRHNWYKFQSRVMQAAELKSLKLADISFCCSENDRERYKMNNNSASIEVIPNGVDLNYFRASGQPEDPSILLFTGTMNYGPNADAVKWFLNDIFPVVLTSHPDTIFIIAGKCAGALENLCSKNIKVVSDPLDIRPYFAQAAIYVVPLRQGSGTRLKILEAEPHK